MENDIKQAMHVGNAKSFGSAEANENERRWDDWKFDQKNLDPTNNYDKSRRHLNFEVGPDGKIHPLGYREKPLDVRLNERLAELGWKPFKSDSPNQPNMCAKFIFGGNRERTLEMAFGSQDVDFSKDADNSGLRRCKEIESWAKDVHAWCARRFGSENVIGFQVHLDESSPHIHALIVPVGTRGKKQRKAVMWSAKFGKNPSEYGAVLREMHTSLYEEVGAKYGLERGDSVRGRDVRHLSKKEYIRKLEREMRQAEKALKGLQTMIQNYREQISSQKEALGDLEDSLLSGRIELRQYKIHREEALRDIKECEEKLNDKTAKVAQKEEELNRLTAEIRTVRSTAGVFRNIRVDYDVPQIKEKVPPFGAGKWLERQNKMIDKQFRAVVGKIEKLYCQEAENQVKAVQKSILFDYDELYSLRGKVKSLLADKEESDYLLETLYSMIETPDLRTQVFTLFDALSGGASVSVGTGGGGSDSDLPWDGRHWDEDDQTFRRRCLYYAFASVQKRRFTRGR